MKKIFIFFLLFISSCQPANFFKNEPTIFGIQENQFKNLNEQQQQQLITSYNRQQEIRAKNEPMQNLVHVLDKSVKQESRTTVQIHHHTLDQPIRQCYIRGTTQVCEEIVQTTQNNTSNYNWEFGKHIVG